MCVCPGKESQLTVRAASDVLLLDRTTTSTAWDGPRGFGFELRGSDATWRLCADTLDERDDWLGSLQVKAPVQV